MKLSLQHTLSDPESIIKFYQYAENQELEGIVLKEPNLAYIPGDETHWIKIKRFETLDLTILGLYNATKGSGEKYGHALVATLNQERNTYESIGKVNIIRTNPSTGRTFASEIRTMIKRGTSKHPSDKANYGLAEPDVYIEPDESLVLEVGAVEINFGPAHPYSCGKDAKNNAYSLRIGHVRTIREDKNPEQSTTTQEVRKLYEKKFSKNS